MSENRKKLYGLFAAVLGIEESKITPKLSPANCPSWDSFNAILLISEIESAFGARFSYEEAMAVKNMGGVFALLEKKGISL